MATLTQIGLMLIIGLFLFGLLVVAASRISISASLLPQPVNDVVAKLFPRTAILDATAGESGEFLVEIITSGEPRAVKVRRFEDSEITVAWTFDANADIPKSGKFAFISLRHNLQQDSAVTPEDVRARIKRSLEAVLAPKQWEQSSEDSADIQISVFVALENEVTLDRTNDALDRNDLHEWGGALANALRHETVSEMPTFAHGSLVLDIVDSKTKKHLWRAAAISDIVVDVSEHEKDRRTHRAIAGMLERFPPKSTRLGSPINTAGAPPQYQSYRRG